MLYVTCGKLIVTRLKETWPQDLASLVAAYDGRGTEAKPMLDERWGVQHLLDAHLKEYPQAEELWSRVPSPMKTIIDMCLRVDPALRPSVPDLLSSPEYEKLLAAHHTSIAGNSSAATKQQMNADERQMLRQHIDDLTERLATREERMICLETLLATEREAHFRTAALLEEKTESLEEALEKIAELRADDDDQEQEPPVPAVMGLHHPGTPQRLSNALYCMCFIDPRQNKQEI
jgi:hypothetical protein